MRRRVRDRRFFGSAGAGGGPAPAWTPLAFTGLRLYLNADTAIASPVASWTDQSPQLNHATQANGVQRPTVTSSWNAGFPAVTSDGFQFLDLAANVVTAGTAFTVWLIGQVLGIGPDLTGGTIISMRKTTKYTSVMHFSSSGGHYVSGNGVDAGANCQITSNVADVLAPFEQSMTFGGTGVAPVTRINGAVQPATGGGVQFAEDGDPGGTVFMSVGQNMTGHISVLAVTDHVSTAPERALWDAYCSSRGV